MAQIGDRIGPFELVERVRRGRGTSLFRATRRESLQRLPREVAIRVANTGAEAELLEGLRVEYETLRLLADERIPGACAHYAGHGAVALQWVRGAPLRAALRLVEEGRLDLDATTSVDILVELAYALRHAHAIVRDEGRIVHGMLSADVVWLTPTGGVVIHGFADPDPTHTWPLAPEQQHGVQDPRTDQWLLGALGIELLRRAPEVLDAARGAPIDVAFGLIQSEWPAAARLLGKMLTEDAAHRYTSEEQLIKDLLALARGLGGVSRRAEVGARTVQLAGAATVEVAEEPESDGGYDADAERTVVHAAVEAPPPPMLIERTASRSSGAPLTLDAESFLPSTWPRFDAPPPAIRPPPPIRARAAVAPSVERSAAEVEPTLVEAGPGADDEATLVREAPAAYAEEEFELGPVDDVSADAPLPAIEVPAIEVPAIRIAAPSTEVPAVRIAAPSIEVPAIRIAAPSIEVPTIEVPAIRIAPVSAEETHAEVLVEEEDTGAEPLPAAHASTGVPVHAAAESLLGGDDPAEARDEAPVRPARPARPADDPVPDQWVVGSIAVFAVVAVLAAAWSVV